MPLKNSLSLLLCEEDEGSWLSNPLCSTSNFLFIWGVKIGHLGSKTRSDAPECGSSAVGVRVKCGCRASLTRTKWLLLHQVLAGVRVKCGSDPHLTRHLSSSQQINSLVQVRARLKCGCDPHLTRHLSGCLALLPSFMPISPVFHPKLPQSTPNTSSV